MKAIRTLLLAVSASALFSGCHHGFGPEALKRTYPGYNETLSQVWNEQLLLNIVRLRYREQPAFLDIAAISAEQTLSAQIGGAADLKNNDTSVQNTGTETILKPAFQFTRSETPKLTYTPLQGQEFSKRVMRPIQGSVVLTLIQTGWKADRVFNLCVERINNISNAPTASGPTPDIAPEYKKFMHFSRLLRKLQNKDLILIGKKPKEFASTVIRFVDDKELAKEIDELKKMLDLDLTYADFKVKDNFLDMGDDKLTFRFRSLLGIMFYLSNSVEVPQPHKEKNLVNITKNPDGSEFDWKIITHKQLTIHAQKDRPKTASISVKYRDYWYFVDETDHNSQATIMLLNTLFSLQTANLKPVEPFLLLN